MEGGPCYDDRGGGGGGGGGGGWECQSCDGGSHTETDNPSTGDTSVPPDVLNLADLAEKYGGSFSSGGTTVTRTGSGSDYTVTITGPDGVTTVYEVKGVSGGGGNGSDPDPSDGCTPSSSGCADCACGATGSCPMNCSNNCGDRWEQTKTCCPAAVPPAKPTHPDPADGASDVPGGLNITFSVDPVTSWGKNSRCLADYRTLTFYGSSDKNKVLNLDPAIYTESHYSLGGVDPDPVFLVTAAEYDQTYYWRVVACNGSANCTASGYDSYDAGNDGVWQVTTRSLPGWWQSQLGDVFGHLSTCLLTALD